MNLWKAIETGQFFIRVILPVFPVIEVNTEPIELHKEQRETSINTSDLIAKWSYSLNGPNTDLRLLFC